MTITYAYASKLAKFAYEFALYSDVGCETWSETWYFMGSKNILWLWPRKKSFQSALRLAMDDADEERARVDEHEVACVILRAMARQFEVSPVALSPLQREAVLIAKEGPVWFGRGDQITIVAAKMAKSLGGQLSDSEFDLERNIVYCCDYPGGVRLKQIRPPVKGPWGISRPEWAGVLVDSHQRRTKIPPLGRYSERD